MISGFATTGLTGNNYKTLFREQILHAKPSVVGIAVPYVSASGFKMVNKILDEGDVREVRHVTDVRDGVTHPKALYNAVKSGWDVRVVDQLSGTFHPKLYVGAARFDDQTGVADLSIAITGSPNMTRRGFLYNGECVYRSTSPNSRMSAAKAWLDCWNFGVPATPDILKAYEKNFALSNRRRKPEDLLAFGVSDGITENTIDVPSESLIPPDLESMVISEHTASVAWVGLESFTGEYQLQVEFPKQAGVVLRRIFDDKSQGNEIEILCTDGKIRKFIYKYYEDNGMFRLNIPKSTTFTAWVRENKQGIAIVEHNEESNQLLFAILQPGQIMQDIVNRSIMLETWGQTPTRLYGWY